MEVLNAVGDSMLMGIVGELEDAGVRKREIESNESAQGIAEALGCYIAECIERQYGKGQWSQDDDGYSFRVASGAVIYPMTWAMKKLIDPSEYSLAETYKKWLKIE